MSKNLNLYIAFVEDSDVPFIIVCRSSTLSHAHFMHTGFNDYQKPEGNVLSKGFFNINSNFFFIIVQKNLNNNNNIL